MRGLPDIVAVGIVFGSVAVIGRNPCRPRGLRGIRCPRAGGRRSSYGDELFARGSVARKMSNRSRRSRSIGFDWDISVRNGITGTGEILTCAKLVLLLAPDSARELPPMRRVGAAAKPLLSSAYITTRSPFVIVDALRLPGGPFGPAQGRQQHGRKDGDLLCTRSS